MESFPVAGLSLESFAACHHKQTLSCCCPCCCSSLSPPPLQVFTVEMHHKRVDKAGPGDNVGMNIKGLDKGNMPRTGDVMILKSDQTLKPVKDFTAQV